MTTLTDYQKHAAALSGRAAVSKARHILREVRYDANATDKAAAVAAAAALINAATAARPVIEGE